MMNTLRSEALTRHNDNQSTTMTLLTTKKLWDCRCQHYLTVCYLFPPWLSTAPGDDIILHIFADYSIAFIVSRTLLSSYYQVTVH